MRYLWHAFLARPDVPLLRLPWNALATAAAAVAGFWDPAIWGVAAAGEMIYLLTLASNAGFQRAIDEQRTVSLRGDTEESRRTLQSRLGGAARQRYRRLEEKRERLEALYARSSESDDLFADSNRDAIRKLTWLFLNLLEAQRNLVIAPVSDERELRKQVDALERELASPLAPAVRASKEATLRLLQERIANIADRSTSLAEVEADLSRIETQFDLALEEATLRGRPTAISANVELTSHLLSNLGEDGGTTVPWEREG